MPLLVSCQDLRAGMRLTEAVTLEGRVMFTAGRTLTEEDIHSLQRRFPNIHLKIGDPVLDDLLEFEDDTYEREVAGTVQQKIREAMTQVRDRFSARASLGDIDFAATYSAVNDVLEYLKDSPVTAVLLSRSLDSQSYLVEHCGNVFYLSMILGSAVREYIVGERQRQTIARSLQYDHAMDLRPLALGAMFADLGMLPLRDLLTAKRPLTEAEREAIRKHPIVGADALPKNFSALAKMIVRTHHENYDGSGYPLKLPADKQHIFTRIVRISDAFDAATANHVYREAKSPARVLWEMSRGPMRRYYDPVLVTVFCRLIQPFPIGAKLLLSSGKYGVVVRYNRQNPLAPQIVVAFDKFGDRLPKAELEGPLELSSRKDLRIASFAGEKMDYFYEIPPADDSSQSRPRSFKTLFDTAIP